MADIDVYLEAIKTFGALPQMVIAIEECSELQKEITKIIRKKGDLTNLAEEIADVEIMLEQLKLIFTLHGKVLEPKGEKIERLKQIIEKHRKKQT
jgi:NTP pyrophosphatase (non-canonical NTP hydrolase)